MATTWQSLSGTLRPRHDSPLAWPWLFLVLAPLTGYSLAPHFRPQGSRLGSSFWAIVLFCGILFYCVAPTSSFSVLHVHLWPNMPSSWLCSSTHSASQLHQYHETLLLCLRSVSIYLVPTRLQAQAQHPLHQASGFCTYTSRELEGTGKAQAPKWRRGTWKSRI